MATALVSGLVWLLVDALVILPVVYCNSLAVVKCCQWSNLASCTVVKGQTEISC